jgi:HK97 gp10 family phage protein
MGIIGMDRLLKQVEGIANINTQSAAMKGAQVIADEAQRLAPVLTGELRDSIHVEAEGDGGADVVAGTDHAIFPEFGTSTQQAQPYMRPAVDTKSDEALRVMADDIQEQIRRAVK